MQSVAPILGRRRAARSYRYPNGAGREASTFLFASGNWFASGREQSVAPRRLVDHKF
jgi:hypothetical protein